MLSSFLRGISSSARIGIGLFGAGALAGCGGYESRPIAEFPNQAALAGIAAKKAPTPTITTLGREINAWTIEEAPLADNTEAPLQPVGPFETLFVEVAGRAPGKPRVTLAMSCYAREIGRFYLEHKAMPGDDLRRFLGGACGVHIPDADLAHGSGEAPVSLKDDELFAQMQGGLRGRLEKALGGGAEVAGFWFGRREKRVVTVVATGVDKARYKPFSLVPNEQGEVVLEGRLKEPVQFFSAYINHGRAGVAACDMDLNVTAPAFRFTCRPAADDKTAWIQLTYAPPKRVLTTTFGLMLMRRSVDFTPEYAVTPYAEPRPVKTPEEFTKAAVEQLNRARAAARLPAVTLAAKQSATATKLAPHFFAAALGEGEPTNADTIALGLLAGWDVGGMIRDASFVSTLEPTLDAGRWLSSALEMPIGRKALFAPDIEQVAFGPLLIPDPGAIGAVVTGYRFHHKNEHGDDVNMLMTRVLRTRRQMGLSEPKRLATVAQTLKAELAAVHEGKASPEEALQNTLQSAVDQFRLNMRGYMLEASSLDELTIPADVLKQQTLHLDIGVTHYKAPGAAWAQYVILVVYADYGAGGPPAPMQARNRVSSPM